MVKKPTPICISILPSQNTQGYTDVRQQTERKLDLKTEQYLCLVSDKHYLT